MLRYLQLLSLIALLPLGYTASAVAEREILIGQSAAFTGNNSNMGLLVNRMIDAYFSMVNQQGGIYGRPIRLLSLDDRYDPGQALANTQKLIDEKQVLALFAYIGTATANAAIPLVNKAKIAFVAPITGAGSMRRPYNPYIFNIRDSYASEAEKIAETIARAGIKRVSILYQDDAYGQSGLRAMQQAAPQYGLSVSSTATVARSSAQITAAVDNLIDDAKAIFVAATYKSAAAFIVAARQQGYYGTFYGLSFVNAQGLLNELGELAAGVRVAQVMPSLDETHLPIINEYYQVLRHAGLPRAGYISLEAFIAAKVLVEGLRRAGKEVSRDKLLLALKSMAHYDLGGFRLNWGQGTQSGTRLVNMLMIADGQGTLMADD